MRIAQYHRIKMILSIFLVILFQATLCANAQTAENRSLSPSTPSYMVNLRIKYLENERKIEETNYATVRQNRIQKEVQGSLLLYFLNLEGKHKEFDSETSVDNEKIHFSGLKSDIKVWIQFFDIFYIWGNQKQLKSKYTHTQSSVTLFKESENGQTKCPRYWTYL